MGLELSRREREIVDILYAAEEASAAEVRGAMANPPSDATVRTLLRILTEKDVVTHRMEGRRFVYRPQKAKSGAGKSALRRVLNVFYDGSVEDALAAHLTDPKIELDPSQIDRLRDLINDAAKKGKRS
ncbi:BlaI/MecI/CopY family transcriptional regulator [Novipirellula artificiosorum]|uniref:Penicillinase repressor n=1 Tax=Novipirellula artificiosorum TaxID=2528016 RepID=A0A5C6E1R2_9BACT|nr:BlaI/MecI/CopY family transcriptional regulator [Novipirellula artificiosorum]TWU41079.1 Penicillinase repressor [Novipirellula artificiosorum]